MTRIAYVTDQLLPQDATDTAQLAAMVSAFGRAGADVSVVAPRRRGGEPPSVERIAAHYHVEPTFRVRPVRSVYPSIRGVEKLAHAAAAMGTEEVRAADLVYTRNLPAVLSALRRTPLPVVYETYRPWPDQKRSMARRFRRLAAEPRLLGAVLHSEVAAESFRRVGFDDRRLLVSHNGYDPAIVGQDPGLAAARAAVDLDPADPRPVVLYAGRVSPDKGLDMVLDLAAALTERARFVIVGSRGDGPIERRAAPLPNVQVVGWQAPRDTMRWLYAADVLLIPPTRGPLERVGTTVLPLKTFLYMATGRVIFAPDAPDVREVLTDGQNAALVPPDDLDAATARLRALLDDPTERQRLARAAKTDAERRTWAARGREVLAWVEARLRGAT